MTGPSAAEIANMLAERAENLAVELLGEPTSRNRVQLRWGRRGSLAVCIAGPKTGQFFDHESDDGGDLLDLVKHQRGGSIGDAMKWSRAWLGHHPEDPPSVRPRARSQPERDDDEAGRIAMALGWWHEARSIKGTMGEGFLLWSSIFSW